MHTSFLCMLLSQALQTGPGDIVGVEYNLLLDRQALLLQSPVTGLSIHMNKIQFALGSLRNVKNFLDGEIIC